MQTEKTRWRLPDQYNYVGVFLTLQCNYRCSYCINGAGTRLKHRAHRTWSEWAEFLEALDTRDIPLTLQGGEPTQYPGFYSLVERLGPARKIDLLTNLSFNVDEFIRHVPVEMVSRPAPYASIRVSYHPESMRLGPTLEKMLRLQRAGYRTGLYCVRHPQSAQAVLEAKARCLEAGIDFRLKPFLGEYAGVLYGRYRYAERGALSRVRAQAAVRCRTRDFLVGPDGGIYRCHHDLYEAARAVSEISDPRLALQGGFRRCEEFGLCEYCDVKVKNDRFQRFGQTTVEIQFDETVSGAGEKLRREAEASAGA